MAKTVSSTIKLQISAGEANPAPPVGPALGQQGVNIMEFCKAFNAQTESKRGTIIPVIISVYEDKSFTFITKTPPAATLIKKAIKSLKNIKGRCAYMGDCPPFEIDIYLGVKAVFLPGKCEEKVNNHVLRKIKLEEFSFYVLLHLRGYVHVNTLCFGSHITSLM